MNPKVIQTRHVLAVKNLGLSARYYMETLCFKRDFAIDGWEFLSLGDFKVMLGECRDEVPASETGNHSYFAHVLVEDVDSLFHAYQQRAAKFLFEVKDQPWGLREFGVETPDGHRLVFGQEIEEAR
ncbi:MAG: VOC family protein [Planctomycetaceae bacterium]|nr:VOC family protein [Planctomycetaceae bacterium]